MMQEVQEQNFADGFAVGELTGRLKHETPAQVKLSIPLDKLKDFKGVLRKYNYTITGVNAQSSNSDEVLLVADKAAEGINSDLILAFTKGDRFMDGWHAGCISGLLRYTKPDRFEDWVRLENLDAVQKVLDKYQYTITSLRIHPENKKWTLVVAEQL